MAIRKIIEIGHHVLKLENKIIRNFKSPQLKHLIQNLKDTMVAVDLIGIAAPQIAQNYQVFVTQPRKTQSRSGGIHDEIRIYINPQLTYLSPETSIIYEGCGCIPQASIFGPVIRPKEIEVEAYNEVGKKFRLRCDGILARVIQHEYDHLQGIEFLEKVSDNRKIISWNFYVKNIRNSQLQKESSITTKIEFSYI